MQMQPATDPYFDGTNYDKCYQCGKCTAGCPVAERMDLMPNQMVRLVQTGATDRATRCQGIWQCVSCQTCTTRCPQDVNIAGVVDGLRQRAYDQGVAAPEQMRIVTFQQAFLENIRRHGRIHEVELIAQYKTLTFARDFRVPQLLKDALLAPKLIQKGKFHLVGENVKDKGVVQRIFARCLQPAEHPGAKS
jgi:heterodisulfide reductase subunit C